jgi:predicted DNA-binding transcriptional regulator YafY
MLEDGSYELRFPYSQTPELLMDLLRHGRHLTVLAPPELAEAVRAEHLLAAKNFEPCARSEHGDGENDVVEKDE